MSAPLTVRAHAKINLDLRVLGTRPDGFHELRTVLQTLTLHDTLTFVPRAGPFEIECATLGLPLDRSNLIWQAGQALWRSIRRAGSVRGVAVRLEKRIPFQSGLGGGSANAAATLLALARLWRLQLQPAHMAEVAARLGADVPFFLSGGTALGLGRGDEIYSLADMPRYWIVLLIPGFGVSSGDAYAWHDQERNRARRARARDPQPLPGGWPAQVEQMMNDLESPVARRYPEISQMKRELRRAGALAAAMSGSGSAVFGLFKSRRQARAAAAVLASPVRRVVLTESLARSEYVRRSRPDRPAR